MKRFITNTISFLIFLIIFFLAAIISWVLYRQFQLGDSNWTFETLSYLATSIGALGGVLLLLVTYMTLRETVNQSEAYEAPAVIVRLEPGQKDINMLHLVIKNTGGGPAYNISVQFNPNLKYGETTLNDLNMFNNMPLLERGEEIRFFYKHAAELNEFDHPRTMDVKVEYFKAPVSNVKSKKFTNDYRIDLKERNEQMSLQSKDMNDLVNEIEELKYALLLTYYERNDKGD